MSETTAPLTVAQIIEGLESIGLLEVPVKVAHPSPSVMFAVIEMEEGEATRMTGLMLTRPYKLHAGEVWSWLSGRPVPRQYHQVQEGP